MNIWSTLPKGFFVQAPMEDVTDTVFRQMLSSIGAPDLYFTEFTNTDGIIKGGERYIENCLKYSQSERPLIAQIWGNTPENYFKSAQILKQMGFDGIDINMGCPVRKVVKHGFCSGLIDNPTLAKELYLAALEGSGGLPVSIKTRIGTKSIKTTEWIGFLLELKPVVITVHARTAREMSKVPVHPEEWKVAVDLRNSINPETLIIANGDIFDRRKGEETIQNYKVDGVMIARGILYNPWVFNKTKNVENITLQERLEAVRAHVILFNKTWGNTKNFEIMKKFFKAYLNGFDGASDLRMNLMQYHTADDTIQKLDMLISELK